MRIEQNNLSSVLPTAYCRRPLMMDVWSIASGSSGNAYLVRLGATVVLLECGIPSSASPPFCESGHFAA